LRRIEHCPNFENIGDDLVDKEQPNRFTCPDSWEKFGQSERTAFVHRFENTAAIGPNKAGRAVELKLLELPRF
jgi:hypothetical protein